MGSSKTIMRAENLFLFQNSVFPWSFALDLAQSLSSAEFHVKKRHEKTLFKGTHLPSQVFVFCLPGSNDY